MAGIAFKTPSRYSSFQKGFYPKEGADSMQPTDLVILRTLAKRIREVLPSARVWAYGSRARGNSTPESDLDVCVVTAQLNRDIRNLISHIAWQVGFQNDMVITTVKYERDNFEHGPCSASPLVKTIMREGVAA